jgi:hypothetical protein
MHEYEIRVLSHGSEAVIEVMHLSDHAAIRAAKKLSGGNPFEVWRGLRCIYSPPDMPAVPNSRSASAA